MSQSPAGAAPWHRQLIRRFGTLWVLKMFGTMAWIAVFFWLYFSVMSYPAPGAVMQPMPVTWVDRLVSVQEWAIVPYASLWVYASLAPALLAREELGTYVRSALCLCVIGLACFWAFPTQVPVLDVDWAQYPTLQFLKARDVSGNACQSLPVGFAVLSAAFIRRTLLQVGAPAAVRALNLAWAAIVVWSVLATRQHVFVDVLGGVAAAALALWMGAAAKVQRVAAARVPVIDP
jgi:hypothetical protein